MCVVGVWVAGVPIGRQTMLTRLQAPDRVSGEGYLF